MTTLLCGFGRIALSVSLAALASAPALAQAPVAAAPAVAPVAAAAPALAAAPAAALSEILPVPLNPVVPAAQRVCSATTASGLGTRVLRDAQAPKPARGDYVLVNYIGYLAADGTVFDQNVTQAFSTGAVIKGFSEGLLLMSKGSIWRFCIPAALGYGERSTGPIPANSDLVFQVELADFKTEAEITAMRTAVEKQSGEPAEKPKN